MKISCALLLLVPSLLCSCINECASWSVPSDADSVSVRLLLSSRIPASRTTGSLPSETDAVPEESGINRVTVGVFGPGTAGSGRTLTVYEHSVDRSVQGSTVSVEFKTTSEASKVVVVANAPAGYFGAALTEPDFIGRAANLAYTTSPDGQTKTFTAPGSQHSTSLPMYSPETVLTDLSGDGSIKTTSGITLTRMVARIAVTSVTSDFDPAGPYASSSFAMREIFLYNANTSCRWDGTSPSLSAENDDAECTFWDKGDLTSKSPLPPLAYLSTGNIPGFDFSSGAVYFYVFPNGPSHPTRLVIKGVWKDTETSSPEEVYYPVVINHAGAGTTINGSTSVPADDSSVKGNTLYNLSVRIRCRGLPSASGDLTSSSVTLTATVDGWSTTKQDVSFE